MAKEYKKPTDGQNEHFGVCTNPDCRQVGPAFMPCTKCGEESGFIYNSCDD
jgi:hypothetical protein